MGCHYCGYQFTANDPLRRIDADGKEYCRDHIPRPAQGSIEDALADVARERKRQDQKWGVQNHAPLGWVAILGEEFGEACKEATQGCVPPIEAASSIRPGNNASSARLRKELIQTAAVCVAFVECLDRGEWKP